jgi:RNA polymerase-binding transcription factor DksA
MVTTTAPFSLSGHRRAALQRLASSCREHDPVRAIRAIEALRRMEDGDYGYCIACGMKIPEANLESRPERGHCSGCEVEGASPPESHKAPPLPAGGR